MLVIELFLFIYLFVILFIHLSVINLFFGYLSLFDVQALESI